MEKAQSVGLQHLCKSENAAKFFGRPGDAHGQQCIASLGGGNQMADRTDAADARHQRGHFGERAALAKFFKAAELRHVKLGVGDTTVIVKVKSDLGVAFDACYGVNANRFADFLGWSPCDL